MPLIFPEISIGWDDGRLLPPVTEDEAEIAFHEARIRELKGTD